MLKSGNQKKIGIPKKIGIVKLKRRKEKGKVKGGFKRIGNVYIGEEQTQYNDW